jgi:hypothetical protein
VVRYILSSPWFNDPGLYFTRYSSPAEYVVRSIREVGWQNFSVDKARSPMAAMGQQLYEPPNVAGWPPGAAWISTGQMLARTNFAATLAASQKEFLGASLTADGGTPQAVLAALLDRVTPAPVRSGPAAGADDLPRWGGHVDRQRRATRHAGRGSCASSRRLLRVPTHLRGTRGHLETTLHS